MKTMLSWVLLTLMLVLACFGQNRTGASPGNARDATITRPPSGTYIEGWNIVGNGTTDIIASESVIDVTPFYNALGTGDICSAIKAALATAPLAETLDARGITGGSVTCASAHLTHSVLRPENYSSAESPSLPLCSGPCPVHFFGLKESRPLVAPRKVRS